MPTVAVDFDGTIATTDNHGNLVPVAGVAEALSELRDEGWTIAIFTCRTTVARRNKHLEDELDFLHGFLARHGIPFDYIYEQDKLIADVYIDDRAVAFRGDWEKALSLMNQLRLGRSTKECG